MDGDGMRWRANLGSQTAVAELPVLGRLCPPLRLGQRGLSAAKHKPLLEVESRGDR